MRGEAWIVEAAEQRAPARRRLEGEEEGGQVVPGGNEGVLLAEREAPTGEGVWLVGFDAGNGGRQGGEAHIDDALAAMEVA